MKRIKITIIILLLLTSSLVIINMANKNDRNDSKKFKEEYEELNVINNSEQKDIQITIIEDNAMVYSNLTEILDIIKNKSGIIYFGFPECPWCRNAVPVLLDAAKRNNIEKIYYLNPKEYRGTDNQEYQELINVLNPYLEEDNNGSKILYVPDVYFIKNGKVLGNHLGTVDSQEDPYVPLSENQSEELYNIYDNLINKIK